MPLQLKLEIRPRARAAVSKVLLVGGATRMPAVKRFLTNMTGMLSAYSSCTGWALRCKAVCGQVKRQLALARILC